MRKVNHILGVSFAVLFFIGFLLLCIRMFTKLILVNKLHMNSYLLQECADYTLGDWKDMAGETEARDPIVNSQYCKVYQQMINLGQGIESGSHDGDLAENVLKLKEDIDSYCNQKYILYNPLRIMKTKYDDFIGNHISYARSQNDLVPLSNGYIWSITGKSILNEEANAIISIDNYAKSKGVDYLYIQLPSRISYNQKELPIGAEDYTNSNIDSKLKLMSSQQVNCYDLRKDMIDQGWNGEQGYFLTDSHWTPESGFWATQNIISYLESNYSLDFDEKKYARTQYFDITYELNNKSNSETVTLLYPKFDTQLIFLDYMRNYKIEGSFQESCIDNSMLNSCFRKQVLDIYSASRIRNTQLGEIKNNLNASNQQRILVCANSMSWYIVQYLALDIEDIYFTADTTSEQVQYLIDSIHPDLVLKISL